MKALTGKQLIAALKKRANLDKPIHFCFEKLDAFEGRSFTIGFCTGISINTKPNRVCINGIQVLSNRKGKFVLI